jgi:hypothetical protein
MERFGVTRASIVFRPRAWRSVSRNRLHWHCKSEP